MKYLPTEDITYKTSLNEAELIQRLEASIEPEKVFRFGWLKKSDTKSYRGKVTDSSFNISRIINYRNSFLPRISGNIENTFEGSLIKVKMRLHVAVIAFLSVWCGIMGLVCIAFLSQSFGSTGFGLMALMPFGMLLFVYLLTLWAFKYESKLSKADLQNLFEAEIMEE